MSDPKVVLVTGAAGYWGRRLAQRLLAEDHVRLIAIDQQAPEQPAAGLDFRPADVRSPLLVEMLRDEGVQSVCHLQFREEVAGSEATFDLNVVGTIKLLETCSEAGVGHVVLRSSTAVYGARPDNSAFLTEETPLRGSATYGFNRDWLEIEGFVGGLMSQANGPAVTVLRLASVVGPTADSPMTRFLKIPLPPVLLGFDPMLQFLHEDDAVEALAHAVLSGLPGIFNVAAEGALPLTKLLSLARKLPLPVAHPLAYWGLNWLRGSRWRPESYFPLEPDYLRYPWVADLGRMREELGFAPQYTAEEAVRSMFTSSPEDQNGTPEGMERRLTLTNAD